MQPAGASLSLRAAQELFPLLSQPYVTSPRLSAPSLPTLLLLLPSRLAPSCAVQAFQYAYAAELTGCCCFQEGLLFAAMAPQTCVCLPLCCSTASPTIW